MSEPTWIERQEQARAEGEQAADAGLEFRRDCPYTYDKFPGMSYEEFNSFKRPLMDAWFEGWKARRDSKKQGAAND